MTTVDLAPAALAARIVLVVALTVFVGLAVEEIYKSENRTLPGGIRTFPMLGMSGAMLYLIEPVHALAFVVGLFALALWLNAYLRVVPRDGAVPSLMIPASNLLAYVIGPVALIEPPWVAVGLAVTAVLLLGARERLHRLIHVVPREELLTAGKFLLLVGIVLPLVPDEPVTTATPLTPYDLWLAVVAVCALSYATYLLRRYLPMRNGALLPAVLGGAYSSTATTVVLAKHQREIGRIRPDISAGIVAATSIMYIRLGVVVALFNQRLAWALAPGLLALAAMAAAMAAYEWRTTAGRDSDLRLAVPTMNPLQISMAAIVAAAFVAVSIVSAWARTAFGQSGVFALATIVGATDIDPFVLNIAQGGVSDMPAAALCAAVLVAASSNNVIKGAYALGFGGVAAARSAAMLIVLAALGLAAAAIYIIYPVR